MRNVGFFFLLSFLKSKQVSILLDKFCVSIFHPRRFKNVTKDSFFWKLHLLVLSYFVKLVQSRSIRRKLKRYVKSIQRYYNEWSIYSYIHCSHVIILQNIFEKKNYCSLMYIRDYYSFTLISKRIKKVQSICLPFLKYIHEFNYFQKKIEILYLKTLVVLIII